MVSYLNHISHNESGNSISEYDLGNSPLFDGQWHHIAYVQGNGENTNSGKSTFNIIVDGEAVISNGHLNSTPSNSTSNITIGASDGADYWDGSIKDVQVYDKPLSANEIKDTVMEHNVVNGVVAHYDFDTTNGGVYADKSPAGTAHNGTATNNPTITEKIDIDTEDTLTGGASGERFDALDGEQTVDAKGGNDTIVTKGADTVDAGAGDDTIQALDNDFKSIDGGVGFDILELEHEGSIDISHISAKVNNVEVIDLDNSNNQNVSINLEEVIDMTDDDNDLVFIGNDGDVINFEDSDKWSKEEGVKTVDGVDGNLTEYVSSSNSNISVFIEDDIKVDPDF